MFQTGIQKMCEAYSLYFGNWGFLLLQGAVLFLLLFRYRERGTAGILGICGIAWICFINPISVYLICSMTMVERYVRFFWVFPFTIGIGYVGVRLLECNPAARRVRKPHAVNKGVRPMEGNPAARCAREPEAGEEGVQPMEGNLAKRRARKLLVGEEGVRPMVCLNLPRKAVTFALAAAILLAAGGTVFGDTYFGEPQNAYKIPQEVIEVADRIEELSDTPYVLATNYMSTYLRQYDGNIRLLFGRGTVDKQNRKLFRTMRRYAAKDFPYEKLYKLGQKALNKGVNIIVLNKYQVQNQALETLGFERIDAAEGYYIFFHGNAVP